MVVLVGAIAAVFALWLVLLLRAGLRLLVRAAVTRGDVRLLIGLTILLVLLLGVYAAVITRLV